jgi:hypothetical protein
MTKGRFGECDPATLDKNFTVPGVEGNDVVPQLEAALQIEISTYNYQQAVD